MPKFLFEGLFGVLFGFLMFVDEPGGGGDEPPEDPPKDDEKVDKEVYTKTKNDMHKFKREAEESKRKAQELETRMQELEEKGLEDGQQYKDLAEKRKEELENLRKENGQIKQTVVEDKKLAEIEKFALKHGIRDGYFDLLMAHDMSDVEVETTSTGRFNVLGAEEWVKRQKENYKMLFKDETADRINNGGGNGPAPRKEKSPKELLELRKKDPEAYRKYREERLQQTKG